MQTYIPPDFEHIKDTARHMVALAKKSKRSVMAKFHDVSLTAKPGSNPDSIVANYYSESNRHNKWGQDINEVGQLMVALAKKTNGPVTTEFNKVALIAKPESTPDSIVGYYHKNLDMDRSPQER